MLPIVPSDEDLPDELTVRTRTQKEAGGGIDFAGASVEVEKESSPSGPPSGASAEERADYYAQKSERSGDFYDQLAKQWRSGNAAGKAPSGETAKSDSRGAGRTEIRKD